MIAALHELRDWLDAIEHDPDDPTAIDQAISIVDRLILQHEPPLPTPAVGLCYSIPTPYSPATAPPKPPPPKAKRPENQHFEINSRKKRKST